MSWQDNLRGAMTPDGIVAEGGQLVQPNPNWEDYFRAACTPTGIKIKGGGGGGGVSQEYVDQRDAATLSSANAYTDTGLSSKQNTLTAGTNITIDNNVISANVISDFDQLTNRPKVGGVAMTHETDITTFTSSKDGLVPHPTAADANKVLTVDGWANLTIPVLYNVIGDNNDGTISQVALTDMFFASKNGGINIFPQVANKYKLNSTSTNNIVIGYSKKQDNNTLGPYSVVIGTEFNALKVGYHNTIIGYNACSNGQFSQGIVAIGASAGDGASDTGGVGNYSTVIGYGAGTWNREYSVGLGAFSYPSRVGEVNIGIKPTSSGHNHGYNNTDYRVIGGVHDGVDDHDAATVGQLNAAVGDIETALSTLNTGGGAQ